MEEEDLKKMLIFRTKQGREQWEKEILPHSKQTRGETMRQIIDEGDYSNFENLDVLMRNRVATMALSNFEVTFAITIDSTVNEIMSVLKANAKGVSPFLDPALRLGLSLAQRSKSLPPWKKQLYRELDEAMSTEVMEATLTHVPDQAQVTNYFVEKKSKNPQKDAEKAISANNAQQIQIAKRLLLMQLSNFQKITKDANGNVTGTAWDKSMAVALSHCSRVVLTLPRQDNGASNAEQQKRMWRAIYTINGNNDAQDNSRASSTHSIERRKVGGGRLVMSKEKKLPFNFIGQRGMNCAIGGRQCDLIAMSAESIAIWMEALEHAMLSWQEQREGMGSADATLVMKMLAGKKMSAQDWIIMKQKLNLPDAQPTPH